MAGLERDLPSDADDPAFDIDPQIRRWIDPDSEGLTVRRLAQPTPEGPGLSQSRVVEWRCSACPAAIEWSWLRGLRPRQAVRTRELRPSASAATLQSREPADVNPAIAARLRTTIKPLLAPGERPSQPDVGHAVLPAGPVHAGPGTLHQYLVPGVGDIPDESVGLLETNPRYVESLLVGANHELSREFLWREYPAQLHDTWFQQFWNAPAPDINPIGEWTPHTELGARPARPGPTW
ncbi:MAG: hypothetical protein IPN52_12300 [Micrococcales bacterium]|nr:hypothetical protein [Micrococcales bacterium]